MDLSARGGLCKEEAGRSSFAVPLGHELLGTTRNVLSQPQMRAAAIDLGKARVGLAVSDELELLAHPRPYLPGGDAGRLISQLSRLARDESIELFLVGLPKTLAGGEGLPARKARRFAELLAERSGVRVELIDERLSTREAAQRLREQGLSQRKARQRVDSAAAAVLLQAWLDQQRSTRA